MTDLTIMGFDWMSLQGSIRSCGLTHPSHNCFVEFLKKLATVSKIGARYYVLFHLVPLLIALNKSKDFTRAMRSIKKSMMSYARSILFMTFLVGGLKAGLCLYSQLTNFKMEGMNMMMPLSVISSFSIWFEDSSRRCEIGYFVLAKAVRSLYIMAKRMGGLSFNNEGTYMHAAMMALLYYVYVEHPNALKFKNIFEKIWGEG